jgi:G6PDH family F420-dependent oxidoreductase
MSLVIPVGLNLASIGVSAEWWLESSRRAEEVGFDSVWIWDHFVSRGRLDDPVLECWTMLAATASVTQRLGLGSFVTNVMNRHPAVLARTVATTAALAGGRVELGIGIGGHPDEHTAYGIPFPQARERAEHLEEVLSVLRLLLAGGPSDFEGRFYRLEAAHAFPVPERPPRITVAGTTPAGTRLAARRGDAWTCFADDYEALRPVFEDALATAGRDRSEVEVVVAVEVEDVGSDFSAVTDMWASRGVDGLIVHEVRPSQLDAMLDAMTV